MFTFLIWLIENIDAICKVYATLYVLSSIGVLALMAYEISRAPQREEWR